MRLYLVQHGEALPKERDPDRPLVVGSTLENQMYASSVAHAGTLVYATPGVGVAVFDVSDPTAPTHARSTFREASWSQEVTSDGDYLYVADDVGGSGGGRPDFAQAGGSAPDGIDRAIEHLLELIAAG